MKSIAFLLMAVSIGYCIGHRCEEGHYENKVTRTCFQFVNTGSKITWEAAQYACHDQAQTAYGRKAKGRLAHIPNQKAWDEFSQHLPKKQNFWIGLKHDSSEGRDSKDKKNYKWFQVMKGENQIQAVATNTNSYVHRELNLNDGDRSVRNLCIRYTKFGEFNDKLCNKKNHYLCEYIPLMRRTEQNRPLPRGRNE